MNKLGNWDPEMTWEEGIDQLKEFKEERGT